MPKHFGLYATPITHTGRYFTDQDGKFNVFHGANIMNKNRPYYYPEFFNPDGTVSAVGESWGQFYQDNGFNVARVGIAWAGVETSAGTYDDTYIQKILAMVQMFGRHGVFVVLDFHQDSWTGKPIGMTPNPTFGGDMFPPWAANFYAVYDPSANPTHSDPQSNPPPPTGSFPDNQFGSPALRTVWDNFYNNVPAFIDNNLTISDTIGVQDRYINMFLHTIPFFKHEKNILFYSILNEPNVDSQTRLSVNPPPNSLADLDALPPSIVYQGTTPTFYLTKFYEFTERVNAAIRSVDRCHMIGDDRTSYEIADKIPLVPKPTDRNIVLTRGSYSTNDSLQNSVVFPLSLDIAQVNDMGFFADEWGSFLEANGLPVVMRYFDKLQVSWAYWNFLQFPATAIVQDQTFDTPSTVTTWTSNPAFSDPLTISWSGTIGNPPGSMQFSFSAPPGPNGNVQAAQQFATSDLVGRNVSIDIYVDPTSANDGIKYGTFILATLTANDFKFQTQILADLLVTTTGWHTYGPFPVVPASGSMNPDSIAQLILLIAPSTGSGPVNVYFDNLDFSGPPIVPDYTDSLVAASNVPATGTNVNNPVADQIVEPYPQIVAGTPKTYSYDPDTHTFNLEYTTRRVDGCKNFGKCDVTAIVVPSRNYPNGYNVSVEGGKIVKQENTEYVLVHAKKCSDFVHVVITPKIVP